MIINRQLKDNIESAGQYLFYCVFQNSVKFPKNFLNLTILSFKNYLKNLPQILEPSLRKILSCTLMYDLLVLLG